MNKLKPAVSRTSSLITSSALIGTLLIGCSVTGPMPQRRGTPVGQPTTLSFAVIGDLGYEPREEAGVDRVFADLNRNLAGVTFLTLLIPGSNNGLGRAPEGDTEYAERKRRHTP